MRQTGGTIPITQTTRDWEIVDSIVEHLLSGESFLLGRYRLTLRGHLWMVDDTVSGLKNIEGISQGTGFKKESEAEYVAKIIYRAWVADEWAQYEEEAPAMRDAHVRALRGRRKKSHTAMPSRREPSMGMSAIKMANELVRELSRSRGFVEVRRVVGTPSNTSIYDKVQRAQVIAIEGVRKATTAEVVDVLEALGYQVDSIKKESGGKYFQARKDAAHYLSCEESRFSQRQKKWVFFIYAPKPFEYSPSSYPYD